MFFFSCFPYFGQLSFHFFLMTGLFSLFLVHFRSYTLQFLFKGDFSLFPDACLRIFSSAWSAVLQLSLSSCLLLGRVRWTFHEQKRCYPHFLILCGSFVWMWSIFNYFCFLGKISSRRIKVKEIKREHIFKNSWNLLSKCFQNFNMISWSITSMIAPISFLLASHFIVPFSVH